MFNDSPFLHSSQACSYAVFIEPALEDTLWLWLTYGKSPGLIGKSTIEIAIFHSFLYVYQRLSP